MKRSKMFLAAGLALAWSHCAMATQDGANQPSANEQPSQRSGEPSEADVMAMMQSLFQVEPLTAEQRARLPQAEAVIARMMPPGAMQQVMGGMFDKVLGPLGALGAEVDSDTIAEELGADKDAIELSDEDAARIGVILDPARNERHEVEMAATQKVMSTAMTAMEPGMRKGMAEAYAATFSSAELSDIERFFTTPSGNAFAVKSYALASDPRIMAAAMEALPAMLEQMKTVEADIKAAQSRLPEKRNYDDLSTEQRAEIARLTGFSQDEIRAGMTRAAAKRTNEETGADEAEISTDDEV